MDLAPEAPVTGATEVEGVGGVAESVIWVEGFPAIFSSAFAEMKGA